MSNPSLEPLEPLEPIELSDGTEIEVPDVDPEPQAGNAQMEVPSLRTYVFRGIITIACLIIGFYESFVLLWQNLRIGVANYSLLVVLMAIVLFIGLDRKRARALNIHDREVDYIIGGIAVLIAITIKSQLLPRFVDWETLLRLDMFALLFFAFGISGLVFGMRSTFSFAPGWILLFGYNAVAHLIISVIFGGGFWGPVMANIIGLSLAVLVSSNRDLVQATYLALMTVLFGVIFAIIVWALTDGSKFLTLVPAVLATITVVLVSSRWRLGQWKIRRRQPTVEKAGPALIAVVVATALLAWIPTPYVERVNNLPGLQMLAKPAPGVIAPIGWHIDDVQYYNWASRYFGPGSSLLRQTMTADHYNEAWDPDGLDRTVVVDTLQSAERFQQHAFGDETLYSTLRGRKSDTVQVDLGYGVVGRAYTVLDETDFLTYTKLVFEWQTTNNTVEKISVIAVDDHRAEAKFPELAPSVTRMFIQVVTILFRGNDVTIDTNTQLKDLDLVSQVGRQIVAEQQVGRS